MPEGVGDYYSIDVPNELTDNVIITHCVAGHALLRNDKGKFIAKIPYGLEPDA